MPVLANAYNSLVKVYSRRSKAFRGLRPSNMGNNFRATCRATMLRCKLRWFVARITTLRNKFSCCKK